MLLHLKTLRAALSTPTVSELGLDQLGLAIAGLEKLDLQAQQPGLCQIAVLGPTQAGKSTLVNALVGSEVTTVSALAGHTRHARGAAFHCDDALLARIDAALFPAQRVAGEALTGTNLDQYSLADLVAEAPAGATGEPLIVWDTPDFDSLEADTYRRAVLAIAGMADIILLIVSRDKYGDMAVWELLERLAPLKRRSFFVVNKVDPNSWAELSSHVEQTQHERLGDLVYGIAAIEHASDSTQVDISAVQSELGALKSVPDEQVLAGVRSQVDASWDDWLAPVVAESAVRGDWKTRVGEGKQEFLSAYRRDYLADADRYDTFQRLLGELLVLLEIPMLARSMGSIRKVVTWPVRKLFGAQKEAENNLGREPELLQEASVHLLLGLRMSALESQSENPLWAKLAQRLSATQPDLLEEFHRAALAHHDQFQVSVAESARELYQRLQESPALLNSLRAVRASADAAGVVVALQTGGIGLADLVLTPVMLSLTTTLTESAAKTYVDQVVSELQEKQYSAVSELLDRALTGELASFADDPALLEYGSLDAQALTMARDEFLGPLDNGVGGDK